MQLPAILAALAVTSTGPTPVPVFTPQQQADFERLQAQCHPTTSYLADQIGSYRGRPLPPKKLTELPPATTYMAVFRHVGPCEAPLTMSDYRNPRRR